MERLILTPTQKMIEHYKGLYVKRILTGIERSIGHTPEYPEIRKIVLDAVNEMSRDIQAGLGYDVNH